MSQFQINARLHSIIKVHRANNEIIFVSADFLPGDFRKLQSKRLTLSVAETNGHVIQEPLPLPVVTPETPEPQMIVIPGQPIGKPDPNPNYKEPRPIDFQYSRYMEKLQKGVESKLPKNIETMAVKFYIEMPKDWDVRKRLQHDGKPHFEKPKINRLIASVLDSVLYNGQIVCTVTASKYWTNSDGYTELMFS